MEIAGPKLENKEAGVMVIDAFDFFDDDTLIQARDPCYKDTVQNVKRLVTIHQKDSMNLFSITLV